MMWIVTLASLIGVVANIYKKRWGFAIWMLTNALWCIIDFKYELYSQSALFAVYFILAIWGYVRWGK